MGLARDVNEHAPTDHGSNGGCLQALQKQSQTLTAETTRLSQQLQMLQKDVQDKKQLHKHTRCVNANCWMLVAAGSVKPDIQMSTL